MTQLAIVMDCIDFINIRKDSSFAMLLEAQRRNWEIYYLEAAFIYQENAVAYAHTRTIHVQDDPLNWYQFRSDVQKRALSSFDIILMRKDPPYDMQYIYTTYFLEQAEKQGTLVVNKPQALRDGNEKLMATWFPECITATLISNNYTDLKAFIDTHQEIILKPLDGMGGASIFKIHAHDPNQQVILETLTQHQKHWVMAQKFIPDIQYGDKRILLIDGDPIPYALARIPQGNDHRGNLAVGGRYKGLALTEQDYWICQQIAPVLRQQGIIFAGIDVIGDYLTEINITSPTCIRELDKLYQLNISGTLFDVLTDKLASR